MTAAMERLIGEPMNPASRQHKQVWARIIVAEALCDQGWTSKAIGDFLGKDHSTVVFYLHEIRNMAEVPLAYQWENELFADFTEIKWKTNGFENETE